MLMSSPVSLQREALAQIREIESHLSPFESPVAVAQLFRKVIVEEVPEGRTIHKRFKITSESLPLGSDMVKRVQREMEATLKAAKESQLSPSDAALVYSFENHLATFNEMQEFAIHSPSIPPHKKRTVKEVTEPLNKKVDLFLPIQPNIKPALIALVPAAVVILLFGSVVPLGIIVLATVVATIAAIWAVVDCSIQIIRTIRDNQQFKEATRLEQLAPLFPRMRGEIKVALLVQLGPDFRSQVVRQYEEKGFVPPTSLLKACAWIDTFQSDEVPQDLKEKAMQQLHEEKDPFFQAVEKELKGP